MEVSIWGPRRTGRVIRLEFQEKEELRFVMMGDSFSMWRILRFGFGRVALRDALL